MVQLQESTETSLEKQVDEQMYSEDELISIKTKLNLPYYTSSSTYERSYGSIEVNGEAYSYVKRRVYQDTLELLCLPNHSKTKLLAACNTLIGSIADAQTPSPVKKGITILKIGLPDLFPPAKLFSVTSMIAQKSSYYSQNSNAYHNWCGEQPERPPQPQLAHLT